LSNLKVKSEIT